MPTPFTGPAGEHYIMHRLLLKEYVAGIAPENAPNVDIIATNAQGTKTAAIQVKTRRPLGPGGDWVMKEKHEKLAGERMFYFFVDLKKDDKTMPDLYVIPSAVVASVLRETHKIWLKQPGKNGRPHKQNVMRRLKPDYSQTLKLTDGQKKLYGKGWMDKYKENWAILGLD